MNSRLLTTVAVLGVVASFGRVASAADLIEQPPYVPPAPVYVEPVSTSGWYIRGDVGYVFESHTDSRYGYIQSGGGGKHGYDFVEYYDYDHIKTDDAFMAGGGLGYRFNDFTRVDVTGNYFSADLHGSDNCVGYGSDYCRYDDSSKVDIWTVMANAYVDFFHYGRFTAYGGAGIGAAYVDYGSLNNKFVCSDASVAVNCGQTFRHDGKSSWRFAESLMAGTSYDMTDHLKLDVGYKYTHIHKGDMFGWDDQDQANGASGVQSEDRGFDIHTISAGLRYEFGGATGFGKGKAPVYAEQPAVDYPVYK